jgi:hypothetical protein
VASLQTAHATWQGLGIRAQYDPEQRPLSKPAKRLTKELKNLGGRVPVAVLLAALERRGHDDPTGLLLDAFSDAPYAFLFYRV